MPDVKRAALRRARYLSAMSVRGVPHQRKPRPKRPHWPVDVLDGDSITRRVLPIFWTSLGVQAEVDRERFWIRYGPSLGVPYVNKHQPIPGDPEPAQGDRNE